MVWDCAGELPPMDILCAGELLVDLASATPSATLADAEAFSPHPGGSPANLAANLTRLGKSAGLVAAVGDDSFGALLLDFVREAGLDVGLVDRTQLAPTTLVLVTRTTGTPDFEVYRGADACLSWEGLARGLARGPRVFHTTCFALSGLPARSHLLRAAAAFAKTGGTLSLDANYAVEVWPERERAREVVREYVSHGALLKVSDDDWGRLYGQDLTLDNCAERVASLLEAGARAVCCTFGGDGAAVVSEGGVERVAPEPVEIVDATGAGDSFWAGFLAAYTDRLPLRECVQIGARVAAVKLRQRGPLKHALDYRALS